MTPDAPGQSLGHTPSPTRPGLLSCNPDPWGEVGSLLMLSEAPAAGRGTWAPVLASVRNPFRILPLTETHKQHSFNLPVSVLKCMSISTILKTLPYKALWLFIYLILFTYLFSKTAVRTQGTRLACEPHLSLGRKAAQTPPDDSAAALCYQGSPGQGHCGPLWLSWVLAPPRRGLLPVTGMSKVCHFSFIQKKCFLDTCSVQGIVKR